MILDKEEINKQWHSYWSHCKKSYIIKDSHITDQVFNPYDTKNE